MACRNIDCSDSRIENEALEKFRLSILSPDLKNSLLLLRPIFLIRKSGLISIFIAFFAVLK